MSDNPIKSHRVFKEVRIRASLLLKAARNGDELAIKRLNYCLKRRRALDVSAIELTGLPYAKLLRSSAAAPERFFERPVATHWNHWFATYHEAKAHLMAFQGFLFPFKNQFVVVEGDFLQDIKLDPDHPDWAKIGFDWEKPDCMAAFVRLHNLLSKQGFSAQGSFNVQ